jgi:fibronectin-binding autotransporter adhesin
LTPIAPATIQKTMKSKNHLFLPAVAICTVFAIVSAPAAVTWTGGDVTWTQPDEDSFTGTFDLNTDVIFGNTGVGAVTVSGSVNPGTVSFNHDSGTFVFSGTAFDSADNLLSITAAGTAQFGNLTNTPYAPVWGDTSISGGGTLAFTRGSGFIGSSGLLVTLNNGNLLVATDSSATFSYDNPITVGAGGGRIIGQFTSNQSNLNFSGGISGAGALLLQASGNGGNYANAGLLVSGADNSGYSGVAEIISKDLVSASPVTVRPTAVWFLSAGSLFTGASSVTVRDGGVLGLDFAVTDEDLDNIDVFPRGGIGARGASGSLAGLANPMSYVGRGGFLVLDNYNNTNNRIGDSTALTLNQQRVDIIGRSSANSPVNELIGNLSFTGGNHLFLNRRNSTNSGVVLMASSLATPVAGSTLLIETGNGSGEFGVGASASSLAVIAAGGKPPVTNGMTTPAIQRFVGANSLGSFVTWQDVTETIGEEEVVVAHRLVDAVSTSTDVNAAGISDLVNVAAAATLSSSKTVHSVRINQALNLGGNTLTLGSGGFITGSVTTSNGTLDFGSSPGVIGAYNAAAQAFITASIAGSGGISVMGSSQSLNFNTGANTFTGGLFVTSGNVGISNNAARFNVGSEDLNPVNVSAFGRVMALKSSSPTVNHNPNIGGLSGTGRVSPWFQDSSPAQTFHITPAASTSHTFDGLFTNGTAGRTLNLVKNGGGKQIISKDATASHTGSLTVNAGSMILDADFTSATGTATVEANGTFGGSGTLGGDATVADGGALTFAISSTSASHDKLEIVGSLTFQGELVDLTITSPGGISAGSYTLATASGGITGTPSFACNLPSGWEGTASVSGSDLVLVVTPSGSTPYDDWAGSFPDFTDTGSSLDPDNDGLENLLEFVLGGDPRVSQPGILPAVTSASGTDLVVTFKRSDESELQPVSVKVQVSGDLISWNSGNDILIGATNGSGPNGATYTVAENGSAPDLITITIPKAAATRKFVRILANE